MVHARIVAAGALILLESVEDDEYLAALPDEDAGSGSARRASLGRATPTSRCSTRK